MLEAVVVAEDAAATFIEPLEPPMTNLGEGLTGGAEGRGCTDPKFVGTKFDDSTAGSNFRDMTGRRLSDVEKQIGNSGFGILCCHFP